MTQRGSVLPVRIGAALMASWIEVYLPVPSAATMTSGEGGAA
jgi:hypothetical protein